MSIRIVTHCYAKDHPEYGAMLRYQISSLRLYVPRIPVKLVVCHTPKDTMTSTILSRMSAPDIVPLAMSPGELFRRSIGRNRAALAAEEDLVWFADVDHYFHQDCLDGLWRAWKAIRRKPSMVYPKHIHIHQDHETGDRATEMALKMPVDMLLQINPNEFIPKVYSRAIGGVQIVGGDMARMYGYLNNVNKWQQPRKDGKPFADFRDDIAYRKFCKDVEGVQGIEFPGLYRIRHTAKTYG